MSDLQTSDEIKKPARRRAKTKRKPVVRAEKPVAGEYAGVTVDRCPDACTADKCILTTVAICGHPFKGAPRDPGPKTKERIAAVRKLLAHRKVDIRGA